MRQFKPKGSLRMIAALACMLSACAPASGPDPIATEGPVIPTEEEQARSDRSSVLGLDLEIESGVPEGLKTLLLSDFVLLNELQIRGGTHFARIFGGYYSNSVVDYLAQRLHYVLPDQSDGELEKRLSAYALGSEPMRIASNISVSVWAYFLRNRHFQGRMTLNGRAVRVDNPRIGIMMLGRGYRQSFPEIARVATLVHEARHSDCPNGFPASALVTNSFRASDLNQCGHVHVDCPAGHAFGGLPACDASPWGAYSMNLIYLAAVQDTCVGCSEAIRQVAIVQAADAQTRLLFDVNAMLRGEFGEPNMAASRQITGGKP